MSKKITVVLSCVLAMALVFTCGYYTGQVDGNTDSIDSDGIMVSREMYDTLLRYMRLDEINMYIDTYYLDDYTTDQLYDGAARGMVYSLGDIYADFFTAEEYQAFMTEQSGNYKGVGVRMSEDPKDGIVTVTSVFKESPAMDAGILPGDKIIAVDGIDVRGFSTSEIAELVRGEAGEEVALLMLRDDEYLEFELIKGDIQENFVEYRLIGDVGYIKITAFEGDCVEGFREAVAYIESNQCKSIILDLRYNGGGLVKAAVEIADMLLPEGVVVYTEDKAGRQEKSMSDNKYLGLPMMILVNEYTASASEILAGAVQDYNVGSLVGTTTYGKGIVQGYITLKDGSCVKITISKYFTPNGRSIHGEGLAPDYEIAMGDEVLNPYLMTDEEDVQLQRALELLNN